MIALLLAARLPASRVRAQAESKSLTATPCKTPRCATHQAAPASDLLLWPPRIVLRGPRLAIDAVSRLVVLGARQEDEHQVSRYVVGAFFDDRRTFGVFPTAFYETGLEPSLGARLVHRGLGRKRETLRLRGWYGGEDTLLVEGQLHSGRRFARGRLSLLASHQRRDDGIFFGLGNADITPYPRIDRARSALAHDTAVPTRFRSAQTRVLSSATYSPQRHLSVGVLQQLRHRRLSTGPERTVSVTVDTEPWVTEVFAPHTLIGLGESVDLYGELRGAWDDRKSKTQDLPRSLPSTGLRAVVWAGAQSTLNPRRGAFGRVGIDVQRWFDLAHGDRVLRVRLRSAWVVGELHDVTFADLPSLGGAMLLRGYRNARFRDRGTVLATVEYRYPVQPNLAGYVFVDAGRVADDLDDLSPAALSRGRLGFGAGLVAFSHSATLVRAQLASSIDGGVFFHIRLDTTDATGPRY